MIGGEDEFLQGLAYACATFVKRHNAHIGIKEVIWSAGISKISQLTKAGVPKTDIDPLRPIIAEIRRRTMGNWEKKKK